MCVGTQSQNLSNVNIKVVQSFDFVGIFHLNIDRAAKTTLSTVIVVINC